MRCNGWRLLLCVQCNVLEWAYSDVSCREREKEREKKRAASTEVSQLKTWSNLIQPSLKIKLPQLIEKQNSASVTQNNILKVLTARSNGFKIISKILGITK